MHELWRGGHTWVLQVALQYVFTWPLCTKASVTCEQITHMSNLMATPAPSPHPECVCVRLHQCLFVNMLTCVDVQTSVSRWQQSWLRQARHIRVTTHVGKRCRCHVWGFLGVLREIRWTMRSWQCSAAVGNSVVSFADHAQYFFSI